MKKERWISTSAAAQILNVTGKTIRNMIEAGRFPKARRIGAGRYPPYQIDSNSVNHYRKNGVQ